MKKFRLFLLLLVSYNIAFTQSELPILKTSTDVLSIKDGHALLSDYWTIDPTIELDVYVADKLNKEKIVTFYSDIDSISFDLLPNQKKDFLIVLNDKDTCYTQIKSGITFIDKESVQLTHDTIPFILTESNNIIIQTVLNDFDTLNLMFHTAQGQVSLTEEAVSTIANKTFDKSEKAITWGGEATSRYSLGNYMKIKEFEWKNITVWEDKNTGPHADGKFGPNLFQNKVIELNYDENIMVIHSYLPTIDKKFEQLDIVFQGHMMFLDTKYKIKRNRYDNKVLLHSGYSGSLLLDDQFVKTNKFGEQLEIISESELKDSYGNVLKTKKAILPCFSLGSTKLKDTPVSFFEGTLGRQHISVIGGNIIKRFNVFIDLQNAHLYLKPSHLATVPFENT